MPNCGCTKHEVFSQLCIYDASVKLYHVEKSKMVSQIVLNEGIKRGFITRKSMYLCSVCISCLKVMSPLVSESDQQPSSGKRPYFDVNQTLSEFFTCLSEGLFSHEQLSNIYNRLGDFISFAIYTQACSFSKLYKDSNVLTDSFPEGNSYGISKMNLLLVSFLCGITNIDMTSCKYDLLLCFLSVLEGIYYLRHRNVVLPLSFATSLIVYSATRSRLALTLLNKLGPYGSYTTCKSWLKSTSKAIRDSGKNKVSVLKDVQTFINNCQVVGKTWNVHLNNKVKASVITTVIHVIPESQAQPPIQSNPDLSPRKWLHPPLSAAESQPLFAAHIEEADSVFR